MVVRRDALLVIFLGKYYYGAIINSEFSSLSTSLLNTFYSQCLYFALNRVFVATVALCLEEHGAMQA